MLIRDRDLAIGAVDWESRPDMGEQHSNDTVGSSVEGNRSVTQR